MGSISEKILTRRRISHSNNMTGSIPTTKTPATTSSSSSTIFTDNEVENNAPTDKELEWARQIKQAAQQCPEMIDSDRLVDLEILHKKRFEERRRRCRSDNDNAQSSRSNQGHAVDVVGSHGRHDAIFVDHANGGIS